MVDPITGDETHKIERVGVGETSKTKYSEQLTHVLSKKGGCALYNQL